MLMPSEVLIPFETHMTYKVLKPYRLGGTKVGRDNRLGGTIGWAGHKT